MNPTYTSNKKRFHKIVKECRDVIVTDLVAGRILLLHHRYHAYTINLFPYTKSRIFPPYIYPK